MSTAYVGLHRKPAGSAQPIDTRRISKYDRRLIVRYFKMAPVDMEPSAYVRERMDSRFSEAQIDRVVLDHLDIQARCLAACKTHAGGFTALLREVESDALDDYSQAYA